MSVRWFSTAGNPFKKRPVREKPKAPRSPKKPYKSPEQTQRVPQLRKPRVERPFADPPKQVAMVVTADERDASSHAIRSMQEIIDASGADIDAITWVKASGSRDDDGWCSSLNGRSWPDFETLFAEQYNKPEKYRNRDLRTGYEADGIIGVSHPGCRCYLKVYLSNGAVYEIKVDSMKPGLIRQPDNVAPTIEEEEV